MARDYGAYTNPQLITNQEFAVFRDKTLEKSVDKNLKNIIANNAAQRASQEMLYQQQNIEQRAMFDKVAGLKETGYSNFDKSMNEYFDMQTEEYFRIKEDMDAGRISQMTGNRALSYMNNQVNVFGEATIPIMTMAKDLEEALKIPPGQPGSISSRVPTAQQEVLLDLVQGGNVKLVDNGGELVLFRPAGNGKESAMINVNEILQQPDYIKKVPDISESLKGAYDNVVKPGGKDNVDLVTFEEKRVGSQVATVKYMSPEQRTSAVDAMVNGKQFNNILNDEDRMESIWTDMMKKDSDWGYVDGKTPEEVEAGIEAQKEEAARWLANKALEDNAEADGVKVVQSTSKYKPKSTSSKGDEKDPWTLDTKEEYSLNEAEYKKFVKEAPNYIGSPKNHANLARRLLKMNPGRGYSSITKSEIKNPEYVEKWIQKQIDRGLWTEEDALTPDEVISTVNSYGDIVIVEGDMIEGVYPINTEDEVIELLANEEGISAQGRKALRSKNPYKKATIKSNNQPSQSYTNRQPTS